MTIEQCLQTAAIKRIDAEVLLTNILHTSRTWLLTHSEYQLDKRQKDTFLSYASRRRDHEPIAYITGIKEFYGRDYCVDSRVLIPRPSTENLIDSFCNFIHTGKEESYEVETQIIIETKSFGEVDSVETVVDIGTGSGCIAITIALMKPDLRIIATDICSEALQVARINIDRFGVGGSVELREGNLLEPVIDVRNPFLIVANPPYIPKEQKVPKDVEYYEPHSALYDNGVVDALISQCSESPFCQGYCIERQI